MDSIFGVHGQALILRTQRAEVLARNLSNSEIPNYKAQDFNFYDALKNAEQLSAAQLTKTNAYHLNGGDNSPSINNILEDRNSSKMGLDGNSVDTDVERSNFMENALRYQESASFISGKIQTLLSSIKGA